MLQYPFQWNPCHEADVIQMRSLKKQDKYTLTLVSHPLILVTYQRSHDRFQNVDSLYWLLFRIFLQAIWQ